MTSTRGVPALRHLNGDLFFSRLPMTRFAPLPANHLPANRVFPSTPSSGRAFAAMDRLLDELRSGPSYLRQPALAQMVVEAIHYNASVLAHYSENGD